MTAQQQFPHPDDLNDDDLAAYASHWRRLALRGELNARAPAHIYETALRERVRATEAAALMVEAEDTEAVVAKRPWWRRWRPDNVAG